jgi:hypothetical protein
MFARNSNKMLENKDVEVQKIKESRKMKSLSKANVSLSLRQILPPT